MVQYAQKILTHEEHFAKKCIFKIKDVILPDSSQLGCIVEALLLI